MSRLGFGTMRLTGPGTWGDPDDRDTALTVLRQAVHTHGISHIDTADAYGPHTVEHLIRDALYPYPEHVLIATKVGMVRPAPGQWRPLGNPFFLRATVEASLRRLYVERLELCRELDIPYMVYRPLGADTLARVHGPQAPLDWLLNYGPHIASIPGTGHPRHLDEIVAAVRSSPA
ncbi:aldo/keto reductase [Streptomyces sp. NPDC004752]